MNRKRSRMTSKKIAEGDLLYHTAHGLCRVDRVVHENRLGKEVLCYALVPKIKNRMKVRYVIPHDEIEASGFHTLVSIKEANGILDYLKAGDDTAVQTNQTWILAQNLLGFSSEKIGAREQRKRQILEHSARGLVGELAYVLKMTLEETVDLVRKSLGKISRINPPVLAALVHAGEY